MNLLTGASLLALGKSIYYLDLGLLWSKKLNEKFSRVFIRYKDSQKTLISIVVSLRIIIELLNGIYPLHSLLRTTQKRIYTESCATTLRTKETIWF